MGSDQSGSDHTGADDRRAAAGLHAEVVRACRSDLERAGWTVAAVTGDVTGNDWAYTVGLDHTHGHPELLLVGLPAPLAGAVVETLAEWVAAGALLPVGAELTVGPLRLRAVAVDDLFLAHGDWFNLGREVMAEFGRRWPATVQLLWADDRGRFPAAGAHPGQLRRQPVLAAAAGA